jgi:hypothetical protein
MDYPDTQTMTAEAPPVTQTAPPLTFWRRLIALFNQLIIFIDRYIHRRQCPYCFSYVTRQVSREQNRTGGPVRIGGISMSLPGARAYECPSCSATLPPDFFASRSSSIAVVGGTEAGKSSFITMFCELLLHRRSTLGEFPTFATPTASSSL